MINLIAIPLAILLKNEDGSDMSMMDLFHAGKEIMWPILLLSFVGITVVVERMLFIIRENGTREAEVVEKMLESVEKRDIEGALAIGKKSKDFIARIWSIPSPIRNSRCPMLSYGLLAKSLVVSRKVWLLLTL
jgi:hypothetical protein